MVLILCDEGLWLTGGEEARTLGRLEETREERRDGLTSASGRLSAGVGTSTALRLRGPVGMGFENTSQRSVRGLDGNAIGAGVTSRLPRSGVVPNEISWSLGGAIGEEIRSRRAGGLETRAGKDLEETLGSE